MICSRYILLFHHQFHYSCVLVGKNYILNIHMLTTNGKIIQSAVFFAIHIAIAWLYLILLRVVKS